MTTPSLLEQFVRIDVRSGCLILRGFTTFFCDCRLRHIGCAKPSIVVSLRNEQKLAQHFKGHTNHDVVFGLISELGYDKPPAVRLARTAVCNK